MKSIAIAVTVLLLVGCMSAIQRGTSISQDKVAQIRKGATTRAELESMFGIPTNVSMGPNGERYVSYFFMDNSSMVLFPGGSMTSRMQQLQVKLVRDIVQDYDFSDNTSKTEAGLLSGKTTTVPTGHQ